MTTPGCHFCKELQDTWQKLAEQLWSEQPQVAVAKLDCTKPPNQGMPMSRTRRWGQVACDPLTQCGAYRPPLTPTVAVCVSHNVAGFPTLRLYVAAPPCPRGARPFDLTIHACRPWPSRFVNGQALPEFRDGRTYDALLEYTRAHRAPYVRMLTPRARA